MVKLAQIAANSPALGQAMAIVNQRIEAAKPPPPAVDPKTGRLPPGAINNNKDLDVNLKEEPQGFFGSFWQGGQKGAAANKNRKSMMEAVGLFRALQVFC